VDPAQASTQTSDLRRANLGRCLREIHTRGSLSRAELARDMQLARSTIGSLVEELVRRGLVVEGPAREGAGRGRPSPVVGASPIGPVVLALDVSTDSLGAAVVGIEGTIFTAARIERQRGPQAATEVVSTLHGLAAPLIEAVGQRRVFAIGVSTPGSVRDGFIHSAVNLGWRAVAIDRLATLAEHLRGAGVGVADFVCLWGEEGIGAGIIAGGRPLMGVAGYAGRVGHWPLSSEGFHCGCGSQRCWETVIGEDALLRSAGDLPASSRRAAVDHAFAALERGDPSALVAVRSIGRWLGIGISAIAETFDPSVIALGGFLGRLFRYVEADITAELREPTFSPARETVRVVPARLGGESALLGAAELAFAPLLADPTRYERSRRRSRSPSPRRGGVAAVASAPAAIARPG
jgi:predicted NBD/HSP70 family sugar kinase